MRQLFAFLCSTLFVNFSSLAQGDHSYSDTLYKIYSDGTNPDAPYFPICGYATKDGDTLIPFGKYVGCFSDEFVHFAIVMTDTSSTPIAVNRDGEALFQVHWAYGEGWPDALTENRIRIVENGKVGFANQYGEIVIEPQYGCASAFSNETAHVAYACGIEKIDEEHFRNTSEHWIQIDLNGNEVDGNEPREGP